MTYEQVINLAGLQGGYVYKDPKGATKVPSNDNSSVTSLAEYSASNNDVWADWYKGEAQVFDLLTPPPDMCSHVVLPKGTLIQDQPSITHTSVNGSMSWIHTPTKGKELNNVRYKSNGFTFATALFMTLWPGGSNGKPYGDWTRSTIHNFTCKIVKRLLRNDDVVHWRGFAADVPKPTGGPAGQAYVRPQADYFIIKETGHNVMVYVDHNNSGRPYSDGGYFTFPNLYAVATRVVQPKSIKPSSAKDMLLLSTNICL
jgi:hypothetical protein